MWKFSFWRDQSSSLEKQQVFVLLSDVEDFLSLISFILAWDWFVALVSWQDEMGTQVCSIFVSSSIWLVT